MRLKALCHYLRSTAGSDLTFNQIPVFLLVEPCLKLIRWSLDWRFGDQPIVE